MPTENLYIADAETILEMARLLNQDVLVTRVVSGLLPPDVDPAAVHAVLDLGCGPGGWVLEVARAYPHLTVTGIDSSDLVIAYARARAKMEGVANAHYQVMDFQKLDYPDASFDVVNARLLQWFLPTERRETIVAEWSRVVRPGGVLRLTENELPMTNSAALEQFCGAFAQALDRQGRTAIGGGRHMGATLFLKPLLAHAHYQDIQVTAHLFDFSAGTSNHPPSIQVVFSFLKTGGPFLLKAGTLREQDLAEIEQQVYTDLASPAFLGVFFFVSAWGRKPQTSEQGSI